MDILKNVSVYYNNMNKKYRKYWNKQLTNSELEQAKNDSKMIRGIYTQKYGEVKKPYTKEYDYKIRTQLRAVLKQINIDVEKAYKKIKIKNKNGRPLKDRKQLTKLHLLQNYLNLTNRDMEMFADIFILNGKETYSYKTIERAYEDKVVQKILHNIYVISCGEPREFEGSADGSGQSLVISKHYRTDRLKDLKEKTETHKRKEYVYEVAILELKTNLYVGFATGFKSEKSLFLEALKVVKDNGFKIKSMILDKGYSYQSIFECFDENTKVMTIPKSNATIKGPKKWKEMLKHWIRYPFGYLKRYFKREASEANFSRDKRKHGIIRQKIKTRIINTSWARAILYNLAMKYIYS
jgi:transposase